MKKSIFYPIYFMLFLATVFMANVFKAGALSTQSFDTAPFATAEIEETIDKPEKIDPEIATTFAETKKASVPVSGPVSFNAPIVNVADMVYGGNPNYQSDRVHVIAHNVEFPRFYYAHETGAFHNLKTLKVGDVFIMGTKKYQVKATTLLTFDQTADIMDKIVEAQHGGTQYSVSLMTCSGARNQVGSSGETTSTHRLIVYADEV